MKLGSTDVVIAVCQIEEEFVPINALNRIFIFKNSKSLVALKGLKQKSANPKCKPKSLKDSVKHFIEEFNKLNWTQAIDLEDENPQKVAVVTILPPIPTKQIVFENITRNGLEKFKEVLKKLNEDLKKDLNIFQGKPR